MLLALASFINDKEHIFSTFVCFVCILPYSSSSIFLLFFSLWTKTTTKRKKIQKQFIFKHSKTTRYDDGLLNFVFFWLRVCILAANVYLTNGSCVEHIRTFGFFSLYILYFSFDNATPKHEKPVLIFSSFFLS